MNRARRYELGVGCLLVVAMAVLAWMALQVGAFTGLGDKVHVTVAFDDASGLVEGAEVAIAGVDVGSVERLTLDGDKAIAHMSLDPDAGVRVDATVSIRARSVLGEKYVAIHPGGDAARLADDGDTLQAKGPRYEIDDVIGAMGPLVAELDSEAISKAMAALSDALEEDPERLERMLHNADVILANTAEASDELPGLAREARTTLAQGRDTLAEIDARAEEAQAVIARAESALAHVDEATEQAPEAMDELRAAVQDARDAMARLEGSTDHLETVMSNLSEIDKWELRRLLREEGILIRLKGNEVEVPGEPP